jgi:hypothetical protein
MAVPKDVLTFRSTHFSLENPIDERGVQFDVPLGDDIAQYVSDAMTARFPAWSFRPSVREDFGTILDCLRDDACICLIVTWFPRDDFDDHWAIQFQQSRGILSFLRKRRPDLVDTLVSDLGIIVDDATDVFTDVAWLTEAEFLAIS